MAKNHLLPRYLLWTIVCICLLLHSGFLIPAHTESSPAENPLQKIYHAEIGIREVSGHNDGTRIATYLRYCGLNEGYSWCAAFVSWCHGQAGYSQPRNAWAAALFPTARRVNDPRTGDVFGLYDRQLRRIAHCGFVDDWGDTYCITVEGNTGPDGALAIADLSGNPIRAGPSAQGVYRKRRPVRTIHAVARWQE